MFSAYDIPGPNRTPMPETKIDRTHILDPKDYWRDPMACPDWPVLGPNTHYSGPRGKAGAEARLEAIGQRLNRGAGALRLPTEDEREQQFAATFRRVGSPWYRWGINNLSPLGMAVEGTAELMAEACHLRGYLRKLAIVEARQVESVEASKQHAARRTLEDYRASVAGEIEAIDALTEAVARHEQRLADEKAVSQRYGLRQQLTARHSAAVQAAHVLGLSVPDAPEHLL